MLLSVFHTKFFDFWWFRGPLFSSWRNILSLMCVDFLFCFQKAHNSGIKSNFMIKIIQKLNDQTSVTDNGNVIW